MIVWMIVTAVAVAALVAVVLLSRRRGQSSTDLTGRTREEMQSMLRAEQEARGRRGDTVGDGRLGARTLTPLATRRPVLAT